MNSDNYKCSFSFIKIKKTITIDKNDFRFLGPVEKTWPISKLYILTLCALILDNFWFLLLRHIFHDLWIIYDVCAVVHNCRIMVLDLHKSCRNVFPWFSSFQQNKDHIKFDFDWIGFHYNKIWFHIISV